MQPPHAPGRDRRPAPRRLLGTLLALAAAAPAAAQSPLPPVHEGTLTGALGAAEERNALVVCVLLQEAEEANDRFYEEVLRQARFVAAVEEAIVVVANDAKHPQVEIEELDEDGNAEKRSVCSRFHTSSCAIHQAHSGPVFDRFKVGTGDDAVLQTPFLGVLLPSGRTYARVEDVVDLAKVLEVLGTAQETVGTTLTRAEARRLQGLLDTASADLSAGAYGAAWTRYDEVRAAIESGPLAAAAAEGLQLARDVLQDALDAGRARMEAGEVADGWRALKAALAACGETPLTGSADEFLDDVRKDKRWRQEIRDVEKEDEAQALFDEVLALLKAEEERKALSRARRLLERYAGTRAAARFRREHADLVERLEGDG